MTTYVRVVPWCAMHKLNTTRTPEYIFIPHLHIFAKRLYQAPPTKALALLPLPTTNKRTTWERHAGRL